MPNLWTSAVVAVAAAAAASPWPVVKTLDLAPAFAARSPWRLVVTQGPATTDYGGNPAPGPLRLCLRRDPGAPCVDQTLAPPRGSDPDAADWGPHELGLVDVVYPRGPGASPALRMVTASLHAGNGGQDIATQLLAYDRKRDAFVRVFSRIVGTNNNEEVRYIDHGPLRGDVVTAEPTETAPYGYWITVSRPGADGVYRQALSYRSATRYDDGDRLAVIDSETPGIERRLGLWRPGAGPPTPLGPTPCPHPQLRGEQLWCP